MDNKTRTLVVFTLVVHKHKQGKYYGYAPYIKEMNLWNRHFDEVIIVGPLSKAQELEKLDLKYNHERLTLVEVPVFSIKSIKEILKLLWLLPSILYKMIKAMRKADAFHFRCPSNVSAIAAVVQVLFPRKPKITKYAGNWDPMSKQPIGYRFQKWILSNRFLTRNMRVLVYGEWKNQTQSVVPFMTASYREVEKINFKNKNFTGLLKFVFIGSMVSGKRPIFTIKLIEALKEQGLETELHMFGDGELIDKVRSYVSDSNLNNSVFIYGNKDKHFIKDNLVDAHFCILPSKSEGWPKAIAEGMFFGVIPISTQISCLPWMLSNGERGILIEPDIELAKQTILIELEKGDIYLNNMAKKALEWSQSYTIERLELEIEKLVHAN